MNSQEKYFNVMLEKLILGNGKKKIWSDFSNINLKMAILCFLKMIISKILDTLNPNKYGICNEF